jgi:hypothetical protein
MLLDEIQSLARQSFALLEANPRHPSLRFKKVARFWSDRVGSSDRALAVQRDDGFLWIWIGSHDEYERLIA